MSSLLRVGLIGLGRWGTVYLRTLEALSDRCRVTHLCTSQPKPETRLSRPVTVFREWRELVRSDCDAVIIATPPTLHAEMLEACLEARKPCIVEKPLCLDVATAERLHERVQASKTPVLVDHTHLFSPRYLGLRRAVEDAGEPIRLLVSEGMGFGPFRTHTSALWDWGPHDVSLCLDLVKERPLRVDALAGPRSPEGIPEQVSVRFDFPGGACAWVHAGRCSVEKRRSLSVVTDKRVYLWDDLAREPLTMTPIDFRRRYDNGVPEPLVSSPVAHTPGPLPLVNLVTYFFDGLAGGDQRRFGTELALDVVRLLAACDRAMQEPRPPHVA